MNYISSSIRNTNYSELQKQQMYYIRKLGSIKNVMLLTINNFLT